ncbi:MAG: MTH938/NDUFAF3 family protein [Proteobacteria bacterium]|nr:MTH938/NDUFAF3 family protein [Pseudomonadota bacterium]
MKFLPQRALIESFGNGGFRFAGMSHVGSLMVLPSGMRAWQPLDIEALRPDDFEPLIDERDGIDFLLLGTGARMARPPKPVLDHLATQGVRLDYMSTSSAIHTYNIVLGEGRRVGAALLAVAAAHG